MDMDPCVFLPLLPQDIIYEILLRVPAESLIRFKTVCKLWSQFISDQNFAHAQLAHQVRNFQPNIFFSCVKTTTSYIYKCDNFSINLQEKVLSPKKIQLHFKDRMNDVAIIFEASFNGLLLLRCPSNNNAFFVCNPLTRRRSMLPRPPDWYCVWALIHDASIKKYKVVGFSRVFYKCFVLTLNNGEMDDQSWRVFVTPKYKGSCVPIEPSILKNKELHQLIKKTSYDDPRQTKLWIYSMDVAKEKLRETKGPPLSYNRSHELLEMKGSLGVTNRISHDKLDIWVLEDGDNCIWSKTYSISLSSMSKRPASLKKCQLCSYPLAIFEGHGSFYKRKILIQHENQLLSYDFMFDEYQIYGGRDCYAYSFLHVNSLVSWE